VHPLGNHTGKGCTDDRSSRELVCRNGCALRLLECRIGLAQLALGVFNLFACGDAALEESLNARGCRFGVLHTGLGLLDRRPT
jgi:hypothetical protein